MLISFVYTFVCLVCLGTLVMTLCAKKYTSAHTMFAGFLIGVIGWIVTLYFYFFIDVGEWLVTIGRLNFATGPICILFLVSFFYIFPRKQLVLPRIIELGTFVWLLGLALVTLGTGLVNQNEVMTSHGPEFTPGLLYPLYALSLLVFLIVTFVIGVQKIRRADGVAKLKIKYALWTFPLAFGAVLLMNVVLPMYGVAVFQDISVVLAAPLVLGIYYSMKHTRFFDWQLSAQTALGYLTNVAFYLGPILPMYQFFSSGALSAQFFGLLVIGLIIALVVFWDKTIGIACGIWSYLFFRRWHNRLQRVWLSLEGFKNSVDDGVEKLAEALGVRSANFVFAEISTDSRYKNIVSFFKENPHEIVVKSETNFDSAGVKGWGKLRSEMDEYMLSVAVPVLDKQKKLLGLLLLEDKIKGAFFSSQELNAVKKMLKEATIYITKERDYSGAIAELKDNKKVKKEFVDGLMHEIRHPLMMARNISEVIDWANLRPEDQAFLKESESSLQGLSQKLERINEASGWGGGTMTVQKTIGSLVQLRQFVREDMQAAHPGWMDLVDFKWESLGLENDLFYFDMPQMKRVFIELGKNASFFKGKEKLKVTVRAFEERDEVVAHYTDNGVGIEKKYWDKIFDLMFVVAPSRNEKESGLGLGLTVARGILRAHGGDIKVLKSVLGEGTTFEIRAPLERYKNT